MIRNLTCPIWLTAVLAICFAALNSSHSASAQLVKKKGWTIQIEDDWIKSLVGCHRFHLKIATNSGKPVADDVEFHLVVNQQRNGREHAITSQTLTMKSGKSSVESDVFINKTNSSYNDYMYVHIEQDGNLHYEQRDILQHFVGTTSFGYQASNLPSILVVTPDVQNKTLKFIRTSRKLISTGTIPLNVKETNLPSLGELATTYPDENGNPLQLNRAGTATDTIQSSLVHALPPTEMPENWIGLTSAQIVLTSVDNLKLIAKSPTRIEAIRKWTAAGGSLVVYDAGKQFERARQIRELVDGRNNPLFERNSPWLVPGKATKRLKSFVIDDVSSNTYYGNDTATFVEASDGIKTRKDWQTFEEDEEFAAAVSKEEIEFALYRFVDGRVIVVSSKMDKWKLKQWRLLINSAVVEGKTLHQRLGRTTASQPIEGFAIEGVGKPPVNEFQFLIAFFVLIIGPISYFVLRRQRRLQLLFLTVPAISGVACLSLLLYALFADGFANRGRIRSFTTIDHNRARAISYTRHSQYAGVQPENYEFDADELVFNGRSWSGPRSTIRIGDDIQSVNGGDIRPRMPHQILNVKNFQTNKGLRFFTPNGSMTPHIENNFSNPVRLAVIRVDTQVENDDVEKTEPQYFFAEDLEPGKAIASVAIDNVSSLKKKIRELVDELSPDVKDEFFSLKSYNYDPYGWYGMDYSASKTDCERNFKYIRNRFDRVLDGSQQYVAVLEQFDEVADPQEDIEYKDKLMLVHGKW